MNCMQESAWLNRFRRQWHRLAGNQPLRVGFFFSHSSSAVWSAPRLQAVWLIALPICIFPISLSIHYSLKYNIKCFCQCKQAHQVYLFLPHCFILSAFLIFKLFCFLLHLELLFPPSRIALFAFFFLLFNCRRIVALLTLSWRW